MTGSRVTVVIPCHNYGRFLGEAFESVERQTRPADEIVIVDDASTDDTAALASALAQRRPGVIVLRHEQAKGPAGAFNAGIRAGTGDLVVILSADDRLSERYLELTEEAMSDPQVGFAYTDEHFFGAIQGIKKAPPFDQRELMRENLYNGTAMFRRVMFDDLGGLRSDFDRIGLEDWEFWVHAVARGWRGAAVQGCWLEYRRHAAGSRNTMPRHRVLQAHLKVWRLHRDVMGVTDILAWMARSARRNLGRLDPARRR
jgi:glycosyltransferase involved in cell wall biosynthesis